MRRLPSPIQYRAALPFVLAALAVAAWVGCSCNSLTERANLVAAESREDWVRLHPDGRFNELIREGEIARGMTVEEVLAAWGMPHIYAVSKKSPAENWIYYVRDRESLSMLFIYTLTFEDDTLRIWDIGQKRFTGPGIVTYHDSREPVLPSETVTPDKKR